MLITGASSGIGAATGRMAVEAGYAVGLAGRSTERLESLAKELGGPKKAIAITCDVASLDDQRAMPGKMLSAFGRIDVVFANAGVGASRPGTEFGDPENWREMVLTNILGCILTVKVCLSEIKRNQGHVLLTGSRAGRQPIKGSVYGATKWAVTGYGYNLREELSGTGARVTLIEPGIVDTPFFDEPKPHALKAEDVARAVMFVVSQPAHVDVSEVMILPTPAATPPSGT
jgi:NADP-dependent 3-hydroxy acid dehydrogenase YdfG